jgi:hypothetical protein
MCRPLRALQRRTGKLKAVAAGFDVSHHRRVRLRERLVSLNE